MNSFLLILKFFLQSSSKQRFWIMFCHHKSVLPGFTQKRRLPRIFRFLRIQRDKGEHPSAVARAIFYRLTTIWLSKTFAIVFANVIAEAAKEKILNSCTSLDAIIVWFMRHPRVNICVVHVNAVWKWQLVPEWNSYRYEILHVNTPQDSLSRWI